MKLVHDVIRGYQEHHLLLGEKIDGKLSDFSSIWESKDEEKALKELLFCILTPQSRAQVCWGAVENMACNDILLKGTYDEVLGSLEKVRFKYRKSGFLIEARNRFYRDGRINIIEFIKGFDDALSAREWFVRNIKGFGYKESSHFLRNIGLGDDLAILDRHILRELAKVGVIMEIPGSMSNRKYLDIEERMRGFSKNINIPLLHLDLVIWHMATGTIFK
ncbi:MAG: N-glycosylase/DNA lyase [Candidatus Thermoplasmatota archaeon]|nr:N-glycosylase/DNA lyase [Candidatus Thermoplasmatota archaeon]